MSRLIELPFYIGDTVYFVSDVNAYKIPESPIDVEYKIVEHKVEGIVVEEDGEIIPAENTWDGWVPKREFYYSHSCKYRFKDSPVFTTKESAEEFISSLRRSPWLDCL